MSADFWPDRPCKAAIGVCPQYGVILFTSLSRARDVRVLLDGKEDKHKTTGACVQTFKTKYTIVQINVQRFVVQEKQQVARKEESMRVL